MLKGCKPSLDLYSTFYFQCLTVKALEKFLIFLYHQYFTSYWKQFIIYIFIYFLYYPYASSQQVHIKKKKITTLRETLSNIAITLSSCYNYDPCCIVYKGGKIQHMTVKKRSNKTYSNREVVPWQNRDLATAKHNLTWK